MGLGRLAVLREPNFRRLYLARTISLVGDGIAPVAIAFAVLELTGSATDLGIVLATHSLLITGLVLVGGVYADRLSPRISMLGADLVRTVVVGLIAILLISGEAQASAACCAAGRSSRGNRAGRPRLSHGYRLTNRSTARLRSDPNAHTPIGMQADLDSRG